MADLTQEQIDDLIQFIDDAEEPRTVTNVIIAAVLRYLSTTGKTHIDAAGFNDLLNVRLPEALQGYVSQSSLNEALSSFAQLDADDGLVKPQVSRFVLLNSMGSALDNINGESYSYSPSVGDLYYTTTDYIMRKMEHGSVGYPPKQGVVYLNLHTGLMYRWTGNEMEEVENQPAQPGQCLIADMHTQDYNSLSAGALVYNPNNKKLALKLTTGYKEFDPESEKIYVDLTARKAMVWDSSNQDWIYLGADIETTTYRSIRNNINVLRETLNALIGSLAGIAFTNGTKPELVAEFTWPSVGVSPQLLLPSGTINVGSVTAGGTVTKAVRIKGANLTHPLYINVSGEGFSRIERSVSAEQANEGVDITISYTGSSAGSAASGTLLIASNDGINETFTLTASVNAADPGTDPNPGSDPDPVTTGYVTDNLILHLDGLNGNNLPASWPDVATGANGRAFTLQNGTQDYTNKQGNGYLFSQASENAVCSADILSSLGHEACTIEVLFTPGSGFLSGNTAPFFLTSQDNKIAAVIYSKDGSTYVMFGSYMSSSAATANTWTVPSSVVFTEGEPVAMSINDDRIMINGVVLNSSKSGKKIGTSVATMEVGARHTSNPPSFADRSACATIHEVRIYTTKLSEKQMRDNQTYDMDKYGFSTTIADGNA